MPFAGFDFCGIPICASVLIVLSIKLCFIFLARKF